MRCLILLAFHILTGSAASECLYNGKNDYVGFVKDAPQQLVEVLEKHLGNKLPKNNVFEQYSTVEDSRDFVYLSGENGLRIVKFEKVGPILGSGENMDYKTATTKIQSCKSLSSNGA
ncbi:hypothetical protein NECAME_13714 [Necator americanus]|uniref:Uncharacterized protein n=1 Tax=Necator americanus TaxID=51031 RepID=W2STA3_NECAM|nr:hypothetical protein NECAME_13714 [Necator americanus]ETN72840.1 hypothetical protein NECAME_13714 [Necator americanus]